MRAAIIKDGSVWNVVEVASLAHPEWTLIASDTAQIGDLWNGSVFTTPSPVVVVPQSVTRRQARQALLLAGLLDSVEPAINAIPDATQRRLSLIEWQDSLEFERNRPLLVSMGTALGLTSAQLDQLFITAASL